MSVFQSQMSPTNQQLLKFYLSQKEYLDAGQLYFSGLNHLLARVGPETTLIDIYRGVPDVREELGPVDQATVLIYKATHGDPALYSKANSLLKSDSSDLSKALQAYCEARCTG